VYRKGTYVRHLIRGIAFALLLALGSTALAPLPALAQAEVATPGAIGGLVTDNAGTPLAGATVTVRGATTTITKTDVHGRYSVTLPPGVYTVLVRAGGYAESSTSDVTLTTDGLIVDATLQRPTLSSLETIGSTSSTVNRGPAFNTSAVARSVVDQETFQDQGTTSIRDVLNEIPGIVISNSNGSANGGSPGAITTPNIRGGLSYETASLIDGHAVSVGKYGDYVTTFLSNFMFGSIEVEKGPGSIPTQISRSINGTVNFRTWDPTLKPTGSAEFGVDGWGGKFANLRFSDTVFNKKLGFVFDVATDGTPGPGGNSNPQSFIADLSDVTYTDSAGFPVMPTPYTELHAPGADNAETGYASNTIACCVPIPTNYLNRSQLAKLRFNFSDETSLTATMLASQTISSQNGNTENVYPVLFAPAVPTSSIPNGTINTFFPYNDNFAYDYEFNNEPIFEGEFHTSLKNDNILARYYSATISRFQTNNDTTDAPFTIPVYLYGQSASGQPLNGNDPYGNPYLATISDPLYQSQEYDALTGYSFEYDHTLGQTANVITFSADENYSSTHVYTPGEADNASSSNIPQGSQVNTGTFLLRGAFQIGPKINLTAGYYLTRYDTHFATFNTTVNPYTVAFSDDVFWHGDERLGAAYRANRDTSLRFALGSGLVPPFLGLLSGSSSTPVLCSEEAGNCPSGYQYGSVYVNSLGGLNLRPETSFGYDFGSDYRLPAGTATVISGDIYLTDLYNQYLKSVYVNGTFMGLPLLTTAYANLSNARYEGIELHVERKPETGLGYVVQGALQHGYPYNIPASIYQYTSKGVPTTNLGVVPNLNFGPNTLVSSGGSAIPYSTGAADLNYRGGSGVFGDIGMTYYGPNNTYNEPAFATVRASLRVPVTPRAYLQASASNLLDTYGSTFDEGYQGFKYTNVNGYYYASSLKGVGPRNINLIFVYKL